MEESEPVTVRVRGECVEVKKPLITSVIVSVNMVVAGILQSLPFLQPHSHPSLLIQVSP